MGFSTSVSTVATPKPALLLWSQRVLALFALTNLGLLLFDATYIRSRDFYLHLVPGITQVYGEEFKGIEPERATQAYLQTVTKLASQVKQQGLTSSVVASTLMDLQSQSVEMINTNPFQVAQKSGTLERIKNRMRDHLRQESAKQAFRMFWSVEHLAEKGWDAELRFFQTQIQPLMATNYFRHIGEDGEPVDRFWQIDLGFISLFGLVIVGRAVYLHGFRHIRWLDAFLWRWSDWLMVIPFSRLPLGQGLWWLRMLPVAAWLQSAELVNVQPLQRRFNQRIVKFFAVELTDAVVVRVLDQFQAAIRQGTILPQLLAAKTTALSPSTPAVDLNGIDEVSEISATLASVVVDHVLPKVKPELDALLRHSLFAGVEQMPLYQNFNWLPGVSQTSNLLSLQLTARISETLYSAIQSAIHDPVGQALTRDLIEKLGQHLQSELRQGQTIPELKNLIVALIEEFKLNYLRSPEQLQTNGTTLIKSESEASFPQVYPSADDRRGSPASERDHFSES